MRVYLPATLPQLARWLADGSAPPARGHAVTPALREWFREGNEEEFEYQAQVAAGRTSLALIAAEPAAPRRRVVLAADVADADVAPAPDASRSAVVVGTGVPVAQWASALVDGPDAEAVVEAAVAALGLAAAGDDDAAFVLDEADAVELGWYAVQELPDLLG